MEIRPAMEHYSVEPDIDPKEYSAVHANQGDIRPKHSGVGIASCIISITCAFLLFMFIVMAGVMEVSTPGGINEESIEAVILGMLILGVLAVTFIGLILGIIGLFQYNRKKLFAILGTAISTLALIVTGTLMLLGILTG
jgi:hypothetical protein